MTKVAVLSLLAVTAVFGADPNLLRLVPPDARVISGIDVVRVKNTPFGRFALAEFSASEDQGFDEFVTRSGFDPRQNLDEIVFATPGGAVRDQSLIIARGTFMPERILDLARQAGARIESYDSVDIISNGRAAASSPQGIPMTVAFLSNSIAVAGDAASIRQAIDQQHAGAAPAHRLMSKVNSVSAGSDAWFVSTLPVAEMAQGLPGGNATGALKGDALKSIKQASGRLDFGPSIKLSAELVTATAQDATNLSQVIRFLAGLVQMTPQANAKGAAGPPLNTVDVKTEGGVVKLACAIPEARLESWIRQAGR